MHDFIARLTTWLIYFSQNFVLIYVLAINAFYLTFLYLSFMSFRYYRILTAEHQLKEIRATTIYKPISILVPAYNEAHNIVYNIKDILKLQYPEFEVVLINDGSTDDTMTQLKAGFNLIEVPIPLNQQLKTKKIKQIYHCLDYPNLVIVDKENGGKADALNAAINTAKYSLIACIDADSLLESDALLRMMRAFVRDPKLIAAGGIIRVLNKHHDRSEPSLAMPRSFLDRMQTIEYTRAFLTGRVGLSMLNSLLIISGAFGLFDKKAVIRSGGYSTETLGEDIELVLRMHKYHIDNKIPYKIRFLPDHVCWTQVPHDVDSLLNQRRRWYKGLQQTLWMHKKMIFNPKYGSVGMIGLPFYICFEFLAPFIELGGYILLILLYLSGRLDKVFMLTFLFITLMLGILISITAMILDSYLSKRFRSIKDVLVFSVLSCVEFFGYHQILIVRKAAAVFERKKHSRNWGEMKRQKIGE